MRSKDNPGENAFANWSIIIIRDIGRKINTFSFYDKSAGYHTKFEKRRGDRTLDIFKDFGSESKGYGSWVLKN